MMINSNHDNDQVMEDTNDENNEVMMTNDDQDVLIDQSSYQTNSSGSSNQNSNATTLLSESHSITSVREEPSTQQHQAPPKQQQQQQQQQHNTTITPIPMQQQQQPFDQLEKYGRWLLSIPRDDVLALRQTLEFQNFVQSFETLKVAHQQLPSMSITNPHDLLCENGGLSNTSNTSDQTNAETATTAFADLRRRHLSSSFLQHFCLDDVLSRIFEYLECTSLVRISGACSRFRELAQSSAHQRTLELQETRQLNNVFKLLRAKEQIDGLLVPSHDQNNNSSSSNNNHNTISTLSIPRVVRVPLLGLSRPVLVQGAGDPEYNGIYFCTTTNGNGFVFTKPRVPEQRVSSTTPNTTWMNNNINGMAENNINNNPHQNNNNNIVPAAVGEANDDGHHQPLFVDGGNIYGGGGLLLEDDTARGRSNYSNQGGGGDRDGRLLRCVIAKRFSNETILWYMSKEVVVGEEDGDDTTTAAAHHANFAEGGIGGVGQFTDTTGGIGGTRNIHITQIFSFWAKLMVIGDTNPDVCRYPSQTSILSRNGDLAWQPLSSNQDMEPPVVELLD